MRHTFCRVGRRSPSASAVKRRASRWSAFGIAAVTLFAAAALCEVENTDPSSAWGRRLQYWNDAIIPKVCCEVPIGEKVSRETYRLAPIGLKFAVVLHIILIGYMLLGLNTVCDAYFTGALEMMVEKWDIQADVAGATFMAAGGSAPELFTSLIGAIIVENNVGFSTIVGSAVFNVLFVIGCCGFIAKEPIALTWWPLFRDCTFYILGLLILAMFARSPFPSGYVTWWEAVVLFAFYVVYCVLMYYNEKVEAFVKSFLTSSKVVPVTASSMEEGTVTEDDKLRTAGQEETTAKEDQVTPIVETDIMSNSTKEKEEVMDKAPSKEKEVKEVTEEEKEEEEEDDEDDIEALMTRPDGSSMEQAIWFMSLPVYGPLYYLIPKPDRCFLGTFGISLGWIAFFSFFLVYATEVLGEVIGIPLVVMGFTLLAAGTSIPDLVSSMAVAKKGEGDMAVSSSIGSNIFDILVGLPIPWMIKIMIVDPCRGLGMVPIPVGGFIVFYVLVLMFMVFCVIVSIHMLGWKLNRFLGFIMGVLYIVFLAIALSVEFLDVNHDMSALVF